MSKQVLEVLRQAFDHYQRKEWGKAEKIYTNFVNHGGDKDPLILFYLAAIYMNTGRTGLAIPLLRAAIHTKPKFAEAWGNMGTAYRKLNLTDDARLAFNKALQLGPKNPDVRANIASLYINEGQPERALPYLNQALQLKPDHNQARWNKSLALLELERWGQAWEHYDFGFKIGERGMRNYGDKNTPVWDGTPGQTVVVFGEQGMGDEIMFASMLPEMEKICGKVVFDCHPRLEDLFTKSFPGIDVFGTRKQDIITWTDRYKIDAKIAIGSLGKYFRNSAEDFPSQGAYLEPEFLRYERIKERLRIEFGNSKPIIPIAWVGGKGKTRQDLRSMNLETMLPILKQDANFVSLQYTDCKEEREAFEKAHGIKIHHWQDLVEDFDETAALIANADIVISVCMSIIHLSGALNIPCWIMTPKRPAWRYHMKGEKMAWYDSIKMYRQENSGDWIPVITAISESLGEFISSRKESNRAYEEATAQAVSEVTT